VTAPSPNEERLSLLSTEQLARFLGVPVKTIYQWRYRGEGPPAYRVGRHLRFRWPDVRAWLEERADGD
jgi:excisionase family DNA binding protein